MRLAAAGLLLLLSPAPQERESAVMAGVRWLIRHQSADGRWSDSEFVTQCRREDGGPCGAKGEAISDGGATSLALIALTGGGWSHLSKDSIEGRDAGAAIQKAFDWLIKQQAADGSIGSPKGGHFVEEHAMATVALGEALATTSGPVYEEPAKKAAEFLLSARTKDKNWGGSAATGWALFALHCARRAGLVKPDAEMKEALASLKGDGKKKVSVVERALHLALDLVINGRSGAESAAQVAGLIKDLKANQALRFDPLLALAMTVARKLGDPAWAEESKSLAATIADSQNTPKKADKCLDGSWNPSPQSPVSYGRVTMTAYHLLTAEEIQNYVNSPFTRGK